MPFEINQEAADRLVARAETHEMALTLQNLMEQVSGSEQFDVDLATAKAAVEIMNDICWHVIGLVDGAPGHDGFEAMISDYRMYFAPLGPMPYGIYLNHLVALLSRLEGREITDLDVLCKPTLIDKVWVRDLAAAENWEAATIAGEALEPERVSALLLLDALADDEYGWREGALDQHPLWKEAVESIPWLAEVLPKDEPLSDDASGDLAEARALGAAAWHSLPSETVVSERREAAAAMVASW